MFDTVDDVFDVPPVGMDLLPAGFWSVEEQAYLDEMMVSFPDPTPLSEMDVSDLADELELLDVDGSSAGVRVEVLKARERLIAHYQAGVYSDVTAIIGHYLELDGDVDLALEATGLELAAALRLTRRGSETLVETADSVINRLPALGRAMARGRLDARRARLIVDQTAHLPDATARQVADQVLPDASRFTTGQLRAKLAKLCVEADSEDARNRFDTAHEERRVVLQPTVMGTAELLLLDLSPEHAAAAYDHIDFLARQLKTSDETRSIDQLRADVAADLLTGNGGSEGRGMVNVTVDLTTLTELSESPGELGGYGPVIADIVRKIAREQSTGKWRYTVTDPENGRPLTGGTIDPRRVATTGQRRQLAALHPTCVFPGCRRPAVECDIDHNIPHHKGGPTVTDNEAPLCRYHHVRRHRHNWSYHKQPNNDHQWTSPLGNSYTTSGRSPPD